jgi:hypothetical protein
MRRLDLTRTDKEYSKVKTERSLFNRRKLFLLSLLLVCLVVVGSTGKRNSAHVVTPQKRSAAAVVFAIAGEPDEYHMDAVVRLEGKRLVAPFSDEQKDKQKKFAEKYFASGLTYRLMFGGGEAGSVKLKKWSEGCNTVHAEVTLSSSVPLRGNVRALATNSDALGKRASARRAPTEAERSAVMLLMKGIYTQHQTSVSLLPSIKVTNLTATDLDGDGKYEMIGSFTLAAKNKFERDLFLIAKPWGRVMRADFAKFQAYQPPPEEFLHSIDFVDQLDLDGNGIGEVFAVQGGFDAYAYVIFRKVAGRWREVYDMTGDAC